MSSRAKLGCLRGVRMMRMCNYEKCVRDVNLSVTMCMCGCVVCVESVERSYGCVGLVGKRSILRRVRLREMMPSLTR